MSSLQLLSLHIKPRQYCCSLISQTEMFWLPYAVDWKVLHLSLRTQSQFSIIHRTKLVLKNAKWKIISVSLDLKPFLRQFYIWQNSELVLEIPTPLLKCRVFFIISFQYSRVLPGHGHSHTDTDLAI